MNFNRKPKVAPPAPLCGNCNKRTRIKGRPDGLCRSCAYYADMGKRLAGKK